MTVDATQPMSGFSAIPRAELELFWGVYEAKYEELSGSALGPIANSIGEEGEVSETEGRASRARSLGLIRAGVETGEWDDYEGYLAEEGSTYASRGVDYKLWSEGGRNLRRAMTQHLVDGYGEDPATFRQAMLGMNGFFDVALATIGEAYLIRKEATIRDQQQAIRELSTPVLPVRDGLLVLPVVGVLDSDRALQQTQTLLEAIRSRRASVAVIDITGVPSVDSRVANHLIQSVAAARLMGASVVISGMAPSIAKALVSLGVEIDELNTVADLQSGLEIAEEMLGYRVTRDRAGS
jgi:rsbT co-antagonist protein RsbR